MLTWEDADGDELAIGTDEHLALALDEMPGPLYKFKAQVVPGDSDDVDDDIEQDLCQLIMLKIKFEMHEQSTRLENRDQQLPKKVVIEVYFLRTKNAKNAKNAKTQFENA